VAIEQLVRLVGEVVGPHEERHIVADIGLEQDAAKHGPLGIDICRPFTGVEGCGRHRGSFVAAFPAAAGSVPGRCILRGDHLDPSSQF
jgi:hypothetical protein